MITDSTAPIPEPAPKKSAAKWVILAFAVLAVAITLVVVLATRGGDASDDDHVEYPLGGAVNICGTGGGMVNGDGGRTLIMDTPGEDAASGDVPLADAFCVLGYLHVPDSVLQHIESTRALDGMQTASWDRYEARWTYHPDSGFDITITDTGGE
jgi:hypothetical protein